MHKPWLLATPLLQVEQAGKEVQVAQEVLHLSHLAPLR